MIDSYHYYFDQGNEYVVRLTLMAGEDTGHIWIKVEQGAAAVSEVLKYAIMGLQGEFELLMSEGAFRTFDLRDGRNCAGISYIKDDIGISYVDGNWVFESFDTIDDYPFAPESMVVAAEIESCIYNKEE